MRFLALPLLLALAFSAADKPKAPKISVKVSPAMAVSPARVVVTADITGGANDFEDFYCATVEWVWGDDTRSNQSADCDPYEAGKSEMKRHFTADHVFQTSGEYRVQFHLKKKDKTIASATTTLKVTPGLGDPGRY